MSKQVRDAMRLFIITIVAGFCLGVIYLITKEPIKNQQIKAQQEAYKTVFNDAKEFVPIENEAYSKENVTKTTREIINEKDPSLKDDIESIVIAKDGNKVLGLVLTVVAHDGYSGDIIYSVGIDKSKKITGVSILNISETAGLGMKAKTDPSFLAQFKDVKTNKFTVVKDGTGAKDESKIDAISGSTITSRAMTNGVNASIIVADELYEKGIVGGE